MEDGVQRRIDAYFPPKAPRLTWEFFTFMMNHQHFAIRAGGGMGPSYVVGLDQWTIGEIAKRDYNIDFQRFIPLFKYFESKVLERQSALLEK